METRKFKIQNGGKNNDLKAKLIGDFKVSRFRRHKPGGAKTLGPSPRPTPFPHNFPIGVRKIHLHIFFNFLKKCGNDQSVLTILMKY